MNLEWTPHGATIRAAAEPGESFSLVESEAAETHQVAAQLIAPEPPACCLILRLRPLDRRFARIWLRRYWASEPEFELQLDLLTPSVLGIARYRNIDGGSAVAVEEPDGWVVVEVRLPPVLHGTNLRLSLLSGATPTGSSLHQGDGRPALSFGGAEWVERPTLGPLAHLDREVTAAAARLDMDISAATVASLRLDIAKFRARMTGRVAASSAELEAIALARLLVLRLLEREGQTARRHLEIGSLFGGGAAMAALGAAAAGQKADLVLIDPLEGYYGLQNDPATGHAVNETTLRANLSLVGVAEEEVTVLKGLSSDPAIRKAAGAHRYGSIMIDGDHSYFGVAGDLLAYEPLLDPGGIMLIHDVESPDSFDIAIFVEEIVLAHLGAFLRPIFHVDTLLGLRKLAPIPEETRQHFEAFVPSTAVRRMIERRHLLSAHEPIGGSAQPSA